MSPADLMRNMHLAFPLYGGIAVRAELSPFPVHFVPTKLQVGVKELVHPTGYRVKPGCKIPSPLQPSLREAVVLVWLPDIASSI